MASSMAIMAEHSQRVHTKKKCLKYADKRVIMALRVKKLMPGEEKLEMMRLLLLRHAAQVEAPKQLSVYDEGSPRQQRNNNQLSELDQSFSVEKSVDESPTE